MTPVPDPVSNIYPSLTYDDAPAAIEWLCRAFGFRKRLIVLAEGGAVAHSELSFGDSVIMVSSAKPTMHRVSPRHLAGLHQALCLRIDDTDAHYQRAIAAGAETLQAPTDESYGSRGYMVKDPEGHVWYFGTYRPGAYWSADGSAVVEHHG